MARKPLYVANTHIKTVLVNYVMYAQTIWYIHTNIHTYI